MKASKFTDAQKAFILKQAADGNLKTAAAMPNKRAACNSRYGLQITRRRFGDKPMIWEAQPDPSI